LRSTEGDEIAIEWEWSGVLGEKANELKKLKEHKVRPKGKERLKYAVLITYTHTPNIVRVYNHVMAKWKEREAARWPLLLILIDVIKVPKSKFSIGKEFKNIQMSVFDSVGRKDLRVAPANPWDVESTHW